MKHIVLFFSLVVLCSCGDNLKEKVVTTNDCFVRGYTEGEVDYFLGVPYAKAPVGELRFAPPQACEPTTDTLSCEAFGPASITSWLGNDNRMIDGNYATMSEDCLSLNIFAPCDAHDAPVLVWIHGGGLAFGRSSARSTNGRYFAENGVVCVTINYRLGALGWLVHDSIADGASLGLLDQIAALQWVHDNIAAFGGDASRVTICGESAGSWSCSALMMSPKAKNLFSQVILQSGSIFSVEACGKNMEMNIEKRKQISQNIMQHLGVSTIQELRELPADAFINAENQNLDFFKNTSDRTIGFSCDGDVLPLDIHQALRQGEYNGERLLYFYNENDGANFVRGDETLADYEDYIRNFWGEKADSIFEAHPVDATNLHQRCVEAARDYAFIYGEEMIAQQMRADGKEVYCLVKKGQHSIHASEIAYVFGTLKTYPWQFGIRQERDFFHQNWVAFIKGEPVETQD